jgi:hypothetical protein
MLIQTMVRAGRMGINLSQTCCPKCRAELPMIRLPANARQMLWGGWTCHGCGCELDKWGRELAK